MANIESIKGVLAPCDLLGVTRHTATRIEEAVTTLGLFGVIKKDSVWHKGIFIVNTHLVEGDELTVMDFVNRLTDVINADGVKELDLDGSLKVSTDESPYEFRVAVREGKVSYQTA